MFVKRSLHHISSKKTLELVGGQTRTQKKTKRFSLLSFAEISQFYCVWFFKKLVSRKQSTKSSGFEDFWLSISTVNQGNFPDFYWFLGYVCAKGII